MSTLYAAYDQAHYELQVCRDDVDGALAAIANVIKAGGDRVRVNVKPKRQELNAKLKAQSLAQDAYLRELDKLGKPGKVAGAVKAEQRQPSSASSFAEKYMDIRVSRTRASNMLQQIDRVLESNKQSRRGKADRSLSESIKLRAEATRVIQNALTLKQQLLNLFEEQDTALQAFNHELDLIEGNSPQGQFMNIRAFHALSPQAKAQFIKAGGRIVD